MKTKLRTFLPCVHSLEERINLSFSISSVVHSLFPFVPDNSNKVKPHPRVVAPLSPEQAAAHPRLAAARAAHNLKVMGQSSPPAVKALAHPKGVYNWYAAKPSTPAIRTR